MSEIICPSCNGAKTTAAIICGDACRTGQLPCSLCLGKGAITQERQAAYENGKAMRADRVGRRVSLSEEAKRLGISARVLSDLEFGR